MLFILLNLYLLLSETYTHTLSIIVKLKINQQINLIKKQKNKKIPKLI